MPIPLAITKYNKKYLNKVTGLMVGLGPFVEIEHVGRKSHRVFHTVIMAFREGDVVTIALTYGTNVDWLKNVRAGGGGRMRLGRQVLTLGPPETVSTAEGMSRMPLLPSLILPRAHCDDFIELRVLAEAPVTAAWTTATT